MPDGIIHDFDEDHEPERFGEARRAWLMDRAARAMVGSDAVLAAASSRIPIFTQPGLYFTVYGGRICYVGQGASIGMRIQAHLDEGRPIERVAVVIGLPKWSLTELEYAYIRAWDPPWNAESTRCGFLDEMPDLMALAQTLDRSAVMPAYVPTVDRSMLDWPQWRLQVLGHRQAHGI